MIIDTEKIQNILIEAKEPGHDELSDILSSCDLSGISIENSAKLLKTTSAEKLELIFKKAQEVKEKVYGKRIVFFAPLYLTNFCSNGCTYCGFNVHNETLPRKALSIDEIIKSAEALTLKGFKRVLLVAGEDPSNGVGYIRDAIKAIYDKTEIRAVHLNAAPMEENDLRELKDAGAKVYQVFQETYHRPTYETVHPSGRKKDYEYRITAMDRALAAGFKDIGIGTLLGLYDMAFDVLSTIEHSNYLFKNFKTHAHTVSVPRLRPAEGAEFATEHAVSDIEFKKAVAVYRLSLPSAGIVVTTRENKELRRELISTGASQFSAGSSTEPGGYTGKGKTLSQFSTSDNRSLIEVMEDVIAEGSMPSLCTTCYRTGRVGEEFTKLTLEGKMQKNCEVNSILTLFEYVTEQGLNGEGMVFHKAITEAIENIKDDALRSELLIKLTEIENGSRDKFI
ncbi:MAG: [FeFe] hydrogenase H-cluster radical SAM maturase HydG [Deltaproteobacteria bacterium]|nr:[FeFe] hydrogenase H-cluster radical SAM maturase HydG [Deltaproteobacteria bacterium]